MTLPQTSSSITKPINKLGIGRHYCNDSVYNRAAGEYANFNIEIESYNLVLSDTYTLINFIGGSNVLLGTPNEYDVTPIFIAHQFGVNQWTLVTEEK